LRFAACRGCVLLVVIVGESDERPSQRLVSRPRPPAIVVRPASALVALEPGEAEQGSGNGWCHGHAYVV
jgi:hypothetical protein